jgi:hypothetical protein
VRGVLGVGVLGVKLLRGGEFPNKGPAIGLVFLGPFGFGGCCGVPSTDLLLGIGGIFSQPSVFPIRPV